MWKGVKEFFTYTKKQRNGLLILAGIAVLLQVLLYFDDFWVRDNPQDLTRFEAAVARWEKDDSLSRFSAAAKDSLFYFDPNTAPEEDLVALGFSPRLASTIGNYRSKGGKFYSPEDLLKIYSMDSMLYGKVKAYVSIASASRESARETGFKDRQELKLEEFELNAVSAERLQEMGIPAWQVRRMISFRQKFRPYEKVEDLYKVYDLDSATVEEILPYARVEVQDSLAREPSPQEVIVDINAADSLELMKVRGIGPAFAQRILEYRTRLGGFHSARQLREVYGIDEERYEGIKDQVVASPGAVQKLDLNTADFKELLRHPYLEYEVVKNIVSFRERVRPFIAVEELQNIELIDAHLFSKIAPYLEAGADSQESP